MLKEIFIQFAANELSDTLRTVCCLLIPLLLDLAARRDRHRTVDWLPRRRRAVRSRRHGRARRRKNR